MQIDLTQKDLLLIIWHHFTEVLDYFVPSFLSEIVEYDIDGLSGYLFEIELGPDGIF